jgi:hypothetical protein
VTVGSGVRVALGVGVVVGEAVGIGDRLGEAVGDGVEEAAGTGVSDGEAEGVDVSPGAPIPGEPPDVCRPSVMRTWSDATDADAAPSVKSATRSREARR